MGEDIRSNFGWQGAKECSTGIAGAQGNLHGSSRTLAHLARKLHAMQTLCHIDLHALAHIGRLVRIGFNL